MTGVGKVHVTLRRAIRVVMACRQTGDWIATSQSRRMVAFDGVVVDDDTDFTRFRVSAWYAHPDDQEASDRNMRFLRGESAGDVDVFVAPENIEAMVTCST